MDLREVLVEMFHCALGDEDMDDAVRRECAAMYAAIALVRLSQPDVLDEFERRCGAAIAHVRDHGRPGLTVSESAYAVREVLSDMLGGGS